MSYSSRHARSLEQKQSQASGVQALRARRAARQKKQQSRRSTSPLSPSKTSPAKGSAMHGSSMRTMQPLQPYASPSVKKISVDQVDLNGAGFETSKQHGDSQSGIKASNRARDMLGLAIGSEPAVAESLVPPELPKASPPLAARSQQQQQQQPAERDEHHVDLPQQQPPGGRTSVASTALPPRGQPSPSPSMQYKDGSPPSRASSITGAHFESASQASPRTMLGAGSRGSVAGRGMAGAGASREHGNWRPDADGSRSSGQAGAGARGGWAMEAVSRGSLHTAITQSAFDVPPMMPPRTPPAGGGVPPAARGLPPASPAGKQSPRLRDEHLNAVRAGGRGSEGPGGLPAVQSWHAGTGAKKNAAQAGGPAVYYIPEGGGDQGAVHASASATAEVHWGQAGADAGDDLLVHGEGAEALAAVQYDARAGNAPLGMDDSFDSDQGIEQQDRELEDQPSTSGHDSGSIPMQPVLHRVPTADREARGAEQQGAQDRHAGESSQMLGSPPGVGRESPVQTSPQRGPAGRGFSTAGPKRIGKQRAVDRGAASRKPAGTRPGGNGSSGSKPGPGTSAALSREEVVRRAREAKQRQRELEDPLAFGRRARPVGYRPKTLGEYRDRYQEEREAAVRQPAGAFSRKGLQARREPGGLGPDLDSEQVRAARAKAQRAAVFAERARQRNKAALGRAGGRQGGGAPSPLERAGARPRGAIEASHSHRPSPQEEEAARMAQARAVPSKRQRALEFAARVREQKMGVDPNARQAAAPSPVGRDGGRARGGHEPRGISALARAGRSVGAVARPMRGTKRVGGGGARSRAAGATRRGGGAGDAGVHGMSELERLELQHDRLKNKMER